MSRPVVTLILTTLLSGVVGFYSGLDAARREVAARSEDHEKRLLLVERDLMDLRKRADLDALFHDIVKQQTRTDEQELMKQIREAVQATKRELVNRKTTDYNSMTRRLARPLAAWQRSYGVLSLAIRMAANWENLSLNRAPHYENPCLRPLSARKKNCIG